MFDFQAYLDEVVDATRSGDVDAFASRLSLPLAVMCLEGTAVMTTREDVARAFEAYRVNLDRLGVTDYVRTASALHMIGPGYAMGVYQTHLLRNGVRMVEPYSTTVTLREGVAGRWRTTSLATAVPGAAHWFRLPPFIEGEVGPDEAEPPVAERAPAKALGGAMRPTLMLVPGSAPKRGDSP
jgi:hypothetical protein